MVNAATAKQWLGKCWTAVADFLMTHVRMYLVLMGAMIVAVLIWAVSNKASEVDQRQRESDAYRAALDTYNVELRAYDAEVENRADCLRSVERSDGNRAQWLWLGGVLSAGNERVVEFAQEMLAELDINLPERSPTDCPNEPTRPTVPVRP